MTTAWMALLATSSLSAGTAWALVTNPKLGGLVVNDGVLVEVADTAAETEVVMAEIEVAVDNLPIEVELVTPIEVEVALTAIEVETQ